MRLLAAISPHGYGHVAQCAPVLNALRRRLPNLELIVRSDAPRRLLEARIDGPFQLDAAVDDFGMVQRDALVADAEASALRYRDFHADFAGRVERTADELLAHRPDLVLADIPYLALAAAQRAGLPNIALCCLNWADIYESCCGSRPEADAILAPMRAAYAGADAFLRAAPSMPMAWLPNGIDIGPVMNIGRNRRDELAARGIAPGERIVVVAMGGIPMTSPLPRWPRLPGVRYVVEASWAPARDDMLSMEALGLPFSDLLASADLLLTKPGYGSFTEAAGCGVPVLWVDRGDWPEQPALIAWLESVVNARGVTRDQLDAGAFAQEVTALLACGRRAHVAPDGIEQAAQIILERLR